MSEHLKKIDPSQIRAFLLVHASWQATVDQNALQPYFSRTVAEMIKRAQPPGFPITLETAICHHFVIEHGIAPASVSVRGHIGVWPVRVRFELLSSGTLRNHPIDGSLEVIGLKVAATGNGKISKILEQVDMVALTRDASAELKPSLYTVVQKALELPNTHRLLPPHIQLGHRQAIITLSSERV